MKTILVLGAGGAAANGFCRALRMAGDYYLVGTNCDEYGLALAETDEVHLLPRAGGREYREELLALCARVKPDLVHAQNDTEVLELSHVRDRLPVFLPDHSTIRVCQNKWFSHAHWKGKVPQPDTRLVYFPSDLEAMFGTHGSLWLRNIRGAGGAGSIETDDYVLAKRWIQRHHGWGEFTAAQVLTPETGTCTSLWCKGKMVVAQGRRRVNWAYARNQPSGVSGITGVGETCNDPWLEQVASVAVISIDKNPHGLFGVDCAKDKEGQWNPTEINIGRFHTTTSEFFAKLGLNIPGIYCRMFGGCEFFGSPSVNPLPEGRKWVRLMDKEPVLL